MSQLYGRTAPATSQTVNPPRFTISARSRPAVLTIAGFDPSSGAGVTADLKVFAAHKLYGLSAITALTVQSTQGVRRSQAVDPGFLAETLECLASDITITGVKIGMLATAELVSVVAGFLGGSAILRERIVLDPVIRSSSGRALLDMAGLDRLRSELLPLVGWITPNLDELAELVGTEIGGRESVPAAAGELASRYRGLTVVVTGGHLDPPDDFLLTADGAEHWLPGEKIETTATHGTGCTFSSALLCQLVAGLAPFEAVAAAKQYVRRAMKAAYPVGKGRDPLHHLYDLDDELYELDGGDKG
ncbi:MAG: bifunctional hydroxymethylpyrimidine kinase/phosphomethylpyrimidine kinase [Silvibacterium sp.]|nr:bifunctional hydroxymethylpyrimidine kinase/phosphomethylpyrimidine kinase [Silvibacterium sp.]